MAEYILPGFNVDGFGPALSVAITIGLVSATLNSFLKYKLLPFMNATMGLVHFLINGMMLMSASALVSGFRINDRVALIVAAISLTMADYVVACALPRSDNKNK